jgi:hypothetical protein
LCRSPGKKCFDVGCDDGGLPLRVQQDGGSKGMFQNAEEDNEGYITIFPMQTQQRERGAVQDFA